MAETKTKVATIRGTLLKPGVSKNKRLYTAENIRSAAEAAKSDLAAGKTLNMYTTHKAAEEDDPLKLVGQFTKVWQEDDGSLKFEANVPDTTTGRDYANLTHGGYQRTISIRGGWGSTPTIEDFDGQRVLTAPTLRLGGADGTASPGVEGAAIEGIDFLESFVESDGNFDPAVFMDITESVEVTLEPFNEEIATPEISEDVMEKVFEFLSDAMEAKNPKEPYGANANYADPGYQKDKKKRYPLDTEQHVKSAWAYINVEANADKYTSAQLGRIKGKIKSAAKKYVIQIGEWYDEFVAGIMESLEVAGINEMYASMTISNGDGSITTNGYSDDGEELLKVAHRIALAAIMGMYFIDPDQDGDVDTMDTDDAAVPSPKPSESTETNDQLDTELPKTQVESADNTEETTNKEKSLMTDTIITAEEADKVIATESVTAPAIDYKALATEMLAQQKAATEAAEKEAAEAAAIEAAKPVTFSNEEVQALVAAATETATSEATAKAVEEARRSGNIVRKGHTTEAANAYYESIQESDAAQETFLGHLSTGDLQSAMSAVLNDDRNLAGTAPKLAANAR